MKKSVVKKYSMVHLLLIVSSMILQVRLVNAFTQLHNLGTQTIKIRDTFDPLPRKHVFHLSTDEQSATNEQYQSSQTNGFSESNRNLFIEHKPSLRENIHDTRYAASDWWHNIRNFRHSSIFQEIKNPVMTITLWSSLVSIVHKLLVVHVGQSVASKMCICSKPHSFLVSALGLLLVFRTNSAYQRFSEGRRIWEKINSLSRSISRMSVLYKDDLGPEKTRRLKHFLAAFPYLLRHHIQPSCLSSDAISQIIGTEYALLLSEQTDQQCVKPNRSHHNGNVNNGEGNTLSSRSEHNCWVDRRTLPWSLLPNITLQKCAKSDNRPLWVCDRMAKEITNVSYSPNFTSRERLTFLSNIDKLSNCIGECERIHQTAVPLNYARHLLRSLTLWLLTLPLALVDSMGLLTGASMAVTSWVLFGVYQIGHTIEDPFQGSLRLSVFCDAIYNDVMDTDDITSEENRITAFQIDEMERIEWTSMLKPTQLKNELEYKLHGA